MNFLSRLRASRPSDPYGVYDPGAIEATTPTAGDDLEALLMQVLDRGIGERVAPVVGALADYGDPTEFLDSVSLVPDMVREWMTPDAPAPTLPSREEYIASRRKPVPSYADYEAAALDKVRSGRAYQDAFAANRQTAARRLLDDERRAARLNYEADKARIEAQNADLEKDYAQVQRDYDLDLEAYYGRSFADRNPITARQLPLMGAIGAGLVSRGVLNKLRKPFNEAVDTLTAARRGTDPAAIASAEQAVNAARPSRVAEGGAFAAGAGVPVEMQMLADVIDAKGLDKEYQDSQGQWRNALARERAAKRLNPLDDPLAFAGNNASAVLSGLLGAYGGAKFASPKRALMPNPSNDEIRRASDDIIFREAERSRVEQALAAPRPANPAASPGPASGTSPSIPQSPYAGRYSSYPRLPGEVRSDLRESYADQIASSTVLPPAGAGASGLTNMLLSLGIDAKVPAGRVSAINKKIRDFVTHNNRMPTRDEITSLFDNTTLAVPAAVGVGAAAAAAGDDSSPDWLRPYLY